MSDPSRCQLWQAFVSRNKLTPTALTLAETIEMLRIFLLPPTRELLVGRPFAYRWLPGGPWEAEDD